MSDARLRDARLQLTVNLSQGPPFVATGQKSPQK